MARYDNAMLQAKLFFRAGRLSTSFRRAGSPLDMPKRSPALIEEPVDARGKNEDQARISGPSRARRLFSGWSASLFQMVLGITQQVALVPVFLHFWTGDILAAWLVIYAVGNLVLIADSGLQFRAINRFLALQIERRLRRPDGAILRRAAADLSGSWRRSCRPRAGCGAVRFAVRCLQISGRRRF